MNTSMLKKKCARKKYYFYIALLGLFGTTANAIEKNQPPAAPELAASAVADKFWPAQWVSRPPPAPWVPITVSGHTAQATDKAISISDYGLPDAISVRGDPLLAGPIQIAIDGTSFETTSPVVFRKSEFGDRLEYSTRLVAHISGNAVTLDVYGAIEYDGLISMSLESTDLPRRESHTLTYSIDIPNARFLHRTGNLGTRNIDLATAPASLNYSFQPYIWIGNDQRGLFWLTETSRGWRNAANNDAISIQKISNDRWSLRAHVVPQPAPDGTWRHRFSLLSTPVKSLPKGWRQWRLSPARNATAYVIWPDESNARFSYFGYPKSDVPGKFSEYISNLGRGGVIGAPYACPTWIATNTPEWQRHRDEWFSGVSDNTFGQEQWHSQFVNVCTSRDSWQAFVKKAFAEFIDQYHLRGLYMDNAQIYATKQCLGESSSASELEFPTLPQRELYRQIVEHLRHNTDKTFAIVHSSGGVNVPSFSSVDAWVNGEQFRGKVARDYLDVATLTDFRVELNGAQWGLIPIFLPEFSSEIAKEIAPTRKLMSILMLHDATVWPQWANLSEINQALEALDRFNVTDADFIPYYSSTPPASFSKPGIYISAYHRQSRTLLIAANLSSQLQTGQLCLPQNSMETEVELSTWPDEKVLNLTDGCAPISIDAGNYRMFLQTRIPK